MHCRARVRVKRPTVPRVPEGAPEQSGRADHNVGPLKPLGPVALARVTFPPDEKHHGDEEDSPERQRRIFKTPERQKRCEEEKAVQERLGNGDNPERSLKSSAHGVVFPEEGDEASNGS